MSMVYRKNMQGEYCPLCNKRVDVPGDDILWVAYYCDDCDLDVPSKYELQRAR